MKETETINEENTHCRSGAIKTPKTTNEKKTRQPMNQKPKTRPITPPNQIQLNAKEISQRLRRLKLCLNKNLLQFTTTITAAKKKTKELIDESLTQTLTETNQLLESYERIKVAVIMNTDWTIENGLMTPSLKVKRNELERIHLSNYPAWYQKGTVIVRE